MTNVPCWTHPRQPPCCLESSPLCSTKKYSLHINKMTHLVVIPKAAWNTWGFSWNTFWEIQWQNRFLPTQRSYTLPCSCWCWGASVVGIPSTIPCLGADPSQWQIPLCPEEMEVIMPFSKFPQTPGNVQFHKNVIPMSRKQLVFLFLLDVLS